MIQEQPGTQQGITDNEIIKRVLQGEKELYSLIVKRYNQRLYRVAMSIINDDNEAEDAMQTAYISAWENLGKFSFRAGFSTWLTRILINECLLRLRKRKKMPARQDSFMENSYPDKKDNSTPVTKMLNAELNTILNDAILKLPEIYRTVFVMREVEEMNVAETGECLNISEANVKVRLNRAKVILRDTLSAYCKKEDILHFHLKRCDKMVEVVMKKINNGTITYTGRELNL